ncbi:MAG: hypothetical protein KAX77_04900 [Xanthomonadales bacterium]|nr:hypothetical protein [Xanthomonadales bacterium]
MNRRYDDHLPSRRLARWFARDDNDLLVVLAIVALVAVILIAPSVW